MVCTTVVKYQYLFVRETRVSRRANFIDRLRVGAYYIVITSRNDLILISNKRKGSATMNTFNQKKRQKIAFPSPDS